MVTNGGKPPRCGDDAPSVMALENRGPCAHRGGGVGPGSEVGFADVCAMPLVRSTVYEMLRMRRRSCRCSWAARARTSSCAPTTPPRARCCGLVGQPAAGQAGPGAAPRSSCQRGPSAGHGAAAAEWQWPPPSTGPPSIARAGTPWG